MENWKSVDGVELTDEILDELAEEAERGDYDLSKAKFVPRGRPSLNGSGQSHVMQVRVDDALHAAVKTAAENEGRTMSAVLRDALRAYVAN